MCPPQCHWAQQVDLFIQGLADSPDTLFNPWYAADEHDLCPQAPVARRHYLRAYLASRRCPRAVLVAEALGYQGGRFSGIAMTSERMLMGHHPNASLQQILGQADQPVLRTSNPALAPNGAVRQQGFTEPTATIVWRELLCQLDPLEFVLWNSVPWHPHRPGNRLSNRPPRVAEQRAGADHLRRLQQLYPDATLIAVGRKAQQSLANLQIPALPVPHPANAGANAFRTAVRDILRNLAPRPCPAH